MCLAGTEAIMNEPLSWILFILQSIKLLRQKLGLSYKKLKSVVKKKSKIEIQHKIILRWYWKNTQKLATHLLASEIPQLPNFQKNFQ